MSVALPVIGAALVRVLWSAVLASVVVAVTFAFAILGFVRGSELRAAGRDGPALAYTIIGVCALSAFAASVVYGLILLTQKS